MTNYECAGSMFRLHPVDPERGRAPWLTQPRDDLARVTRIGPEVEDLVEIEPKLRTTPRRSRMLSAVAR